jgi:hypothetical protein
VEATTNTWEVVAILKPFVTEVGVSNPLRTKVIASAKIKTDEVDALVLAQLLRCDFLPRVWEPGSSRDELYLAVENIEHARTKGKSPQTNAIVERWHKTRLNEFYRLTFRMKIYPALTEL